MPDLVKVAEARKKDMDVLLVSYDLMLPRVDRTKIVDRVAGFVGKQRWNLPVLIYDAPDADAINARFDLPGSIPVTLAFDRDGKLVDREDGPSELERFEALADRAHAK